jgi:hypothetical protein
MGELATDDVEVHKRVQVPGGGGWGRILLMLSWKGVGDGGIWGKVGWHSGRRGREGSWLGIVEALIKNLGSPSPDFGSEVSSGEVERKT